MAGGDPSPAFLRGDRRSSQLPREPLHCFALLFDPGRPLAPYPILNGTSAWPPIARIRRHHQLSLISGLNHTASQLASLRLKTASQLPTKGRFRWGVRPYRCGSQTHGVPIETFRFSHRSFLLLLCLFLSISLSLAGATSVPASRRHEGDRRLGKDQGAPQGPLYP